MPGVAADIVGTDGGGAGFPQTRSAPSAQSDRSIILLIIPFFSFFSSGNPAVSLSSYTPKGKIRPENRTGGMRVNQEAHIRFLGSAPWLPEGDLGRKRGSTEKKIAFSESGVIITKNKVLFYDKFNKEWGAALCTS
jgi:hypothetical protein